MRISADGIARRLRQRAPWLICGLVALACTAYLERRADLVPKWGQWYMSDPHPYVELQLRAMMHGKLALFPHPSGADNDYTWGRGGMQQPWGLGLPILAMPLHLLARLCGAAAFPDQVRFLIFYALAAFALGAALHKAAGDSGPRTAVASAAAAGFFLVFPTFVGLLSARFEIYDQTIATGALWNVVLLAGLLALFHRCTPGRLALVCAAAAFVTIVRVSLAEYGVATLGVALAIAWKRGLPRRALLGGAGAWAAMTALYLAANYARFGAPFNLGYSNGVCGLFVDRMMRWGTSFSKVPFRTAAKEMLATLFLLDPVSSQVIGSPPEAVRPYVSGDRWR